MRTLAFASRRAWKLGNERARQSCSARRFKNLREFGGLEYLE